MSNHTASSAELTEVYQRLAAHYTALAEKESARGAAGYARLNKERVQCLRLLEVCLASRLWQEVNDLAEAINTYLDQQGYWAENMAVVEMNLNAARQQGARRNESMCLNNLGYICGRRGEHEKALMWYEQSLEIDRELEDRQGEGLTLNNIAEIYQQQGNHKLALKYYEQDLTICRKGGDRKGEGIVLNNIGRLYYEQGDYETALTYYNLDITLQESDKAGAGTSLNNIGEIFRTLNNYTKALEYHKRALATRKEVGDKIGEAESCWNIGLTYYDIDDIAKAEEYISKAVHIEEAVDHPDLKDDRKALEEVRAERQESSL
ncbi:hypothetical protein GCAAIG_07220 [Candidatus Electronema halotolerans]